MAFTCSRLYFDNSGRPLGGRLSRQAQRYHTGVRCTRTHTCATAFMSIALLPSFPKSTSRLTFLFSIVQTARVNGVEAHAYLRTVIARPSVLPFAVRMTIVACLAIVLPACYSPNQHMFEQN